MELKKQIRLSNKDSQCFARDGQSYHYKVLGLVDSLCLHEKPIFACISHMEMGPIIRKLTFSLYYGPRTSYLSSDDVKEVSVLYDSYETLSQCLADAANKMLKSETCTISVSKHDDHVCEGVEKSSFLVLEYSHCRFSMKVSVNHICVFTCNVAKTLGFDQAILQSFSVAERKDKQDEALISACKKPIKFEGTYLGKKR